MNTPTKTANALTLARICQMSISKLQSINMMKMQTKKPLIKGLMKLGFLENKLCSRIMTMINSQIRLSIHFQKKSQQVQSPYSQRPSTLMSSQSDYVQVSMVHRVQGPSGLFHLFHKACTTRYHNEIVKLRKHMMNVRKRESYC